MRLTPEPDDTRLIILLKGVIAGLIIVAIAYFIVVIYLIISNA